MTVRLTHPESDLAIEVDAAAQAPYLSQGWRADADGDAHEDDSDRSDDDDLDA